MSLFERDTTGSTCVHMNADLSSTGWCSRFEGGRLLPLQRRPRCLPGTCRGSQWVRGSWPSRSGWAWVEEQPTQGFPQPWLAARQSPQLRRPRAFLGNGRRNRRGRDLHIRRNLHDRGRRNLHDRGRRNRHDRGRRILYPLGHGHGHIEVRPWPRRRERRGRKQSKGVEEDFFLSLQVRMDRASPDHCMQSAQGLRAHPSLLRALSHLVPELSLHKVL